MKFEMCAPCLFGLEGILSNELKKLNMENIRAENGRVYFSGGYDELARANLWLRTAERVLIHMGSFEARSFDDLFEGVKALDWPAFIPAAGAFPVRGHCLDSKLMSVPDCCSIIKKAAADKLTEKHRTTLGETGAKYQIRFNILKDMVSVYIDSSGPSLHKRGYRAMSGEAPLRETLAAGIVLLTKYRGREPFADPFCGSGTIAIEAAYIALNRAPGIMRSFDFEKWNNAETDMERHRGEAREKEFAREYDISGSDINSEAVALANENAIKAGVADTVRFNVAHAEQFSSGLGGGIIATNPPYGVRLSDSRSVVELNREFGKAFSGLDNWSAYILSGDADFESSFGRRADKKRKLYNGGIKCDLYMYMRAARGK